MQQKTNEAVSSGMVKTKTYVQDQAMMYSDQTSYPRGNRDEDNPQGTNG